MPMTRPLVRIDPTDLHRFQELFSWAKELLPEHIANRPYRLQQFVIDAALGQTVGQLAENYGISDDVVKEVLERLEPLVREARRNSHLLHAHIAALLSTKARLFLAEVMESEGVDPRLSLNVQAAKALVIAPPQITISASVDVLARLREILMASDGIGAPEEPPEVPSLEEYLSEVEGNGHK